VNNERIGSAEVNGNVLSKEVKKSHFV
jgi:hypothetical protein